MTLFYKIAENSLLARISAFKLKQNRCAMVIGKTIYLWGINRSDFLANTTYLNHELQHVYQYSQLGVIKFLILYLIESAKVGYYNNKYEVEARKAENEGQKATYILLN